MLTSKGRPRYLPTLTHVVTAAEIVATDRSAPPANAATDHGGNERLIEHIVQSLMPIVTARIQESLEEILDDKLHQLEANMQQKVESLVRRAVIGCGGSSGE